MTDIAQDMASARRRQASADARFSKKMEALRKNGRGGGGKVRGARGGATRGAGTWKSKSKNVTPALLMKVHSGGLAGDKYSEKNGKLLDSNMLGQTAQERVAEWALDAARSPRVDPKNLFKHITLSRSEGKPLSPEQWRQAAKLFLAEIGGECCQFVLQRHGNTKNDHVHLVFSRVKPDGKLVSDSNSFWRWREAVRKVETGLGLAPQAPRPTEKPSTSDRQVSATRRAARRGTPEGWIDPGLVKAALARSSTPSEFSQRCREAGFEMKKAQNNDATTTTGLLYRKSGSEEWLSGSSIDRSLTLPAVLKRLESNRLARVQPRPRTAQQHDQYFQDQYPRPRG